MHRTLTPRSSVESLRREAKRWLRALRADDPAARARLARVRADAPARPTLRDVQHALAREHGLDGWTLLLDAVAAASAAHDGTSGDTALRALLGAALAGDADRVAAVLDARPELASARGTLAGHTGARTALHFAANAPHEAVVRLLLARGADPNVRDEGDDATPLHFAAERQQLGVVRLLVEHGADPVGEGTWHELDVLGWATVLGSGSRDVVDYLISHGARYSVPSAVAMGELDVVRALVREAPTSLERPLVSPNAGRRPLHLAVVKRQPAVVALLLDLGADATARDAGGLTALDQAALAGETESARLLMERGAPIELPAAVALQLTDDVERLLREDPASLRPGGRWAGLIVRASERSPGHIVETLLLAGADVRTCDDPGVSIDSTEGYTALHAAAFHGNADAVRVLLAHGADVNVRDGRYHGTPAGWAEHAGHRDVRDLILAGRIDPFQAIDFDRADRVREIVRREPWLRDRPFGARAEADVGNEEAGDVEPRADRWWPEPWHTPLAWAVVRDRPDAVRALLEEGATVAPAPDGRSLHEIATAAGHDRSAAVLVAHEQSGETTASRLRRFVKNACPDHDIRGGPAHVVAIHAAERLLRRHPELAGEGLAIAVVCGDVAEVERTLAARPDLANERTGPKGWEPLLYLCFTRLLHDATNENAVAIARLLLDNGADPNAYFMAGDSRYTPLVGAIGEGEEERPPHPRRDELVRLLLERGADPYDMQVIYNTHFRGDVGWYLELAHARAVATGRTSEWADPAWRMFDMGGYGSGARFLLHGAIGRGDVALARWLLEHGADANAPPARDPRLPRHSLHAEALRRGQPEMAALLVRHGATPSGFAPDGRDAFAAACLALDRETASVLAVAHPEYLREPGPMTIAVEQDRADVVALLLDLGMSPDVEDARNGSRRPLHGAALADAARSGAVLVERGAAVDARERQHGATPLGFAVWGDRRAMLALLGRHSRDVWNLAFTGNADRLREVLGEEPALARTTTEAGETLLMWLPPDEERALEIAELLLAHGADPARSTTQGATAEDHARRRGQDAVASRLRGAV